MTQKAAIGSALYAIAIFVLALVIFGLNGTCIRRLCQHRLFSSGLEAQTSEITSYEQDVEEARKYLDSVDNDDTNRDDLFNLHVRSESRSSLNGPHRSPSHAAESVPGAQPESFLEEKAKIKGARLHFCASRFLQAGYETSGDFARLTDEVISDSELKFSWGLDSTEVRKIRRACAEARNEIEGGTLETTATGNSVSSAGPEDSVDPPLSLASTDPKEITKFLEQYASLKGVRLQLCASKFADLGFKSARDFASFNQDTVSDSVLRSQWGLERTDVRRIREACAAAREVYFGIDSSEGEIVKPPPPPGVSNLLDEGKGQHEQPSIRLHSMSTLAFITDRCKIKGLRARFCASKFTQAGYKTFEDFANFDEDCVSDSVLKTNWGFEKTEVRRVREACEFARRELKEANATAEAAKQAVAEQARAAAAKSTSRKTERRGRDANLASVAVPGKGDPKVASDAPQLAQTRSPPREVSRPTKAKSSGRLESSPSAIQPKTQGDSDLSSDSDDDGLADLTDESDE